MKRFLQKIVALQHQNKNHNQNKRRSPRLPKRQGSSSGFTLLELLVAALMASIMVVVMLSFLVGVLDSDRKETAKSNAQEELQAAIAYMSDDLQEAIYIYGSTGIAGINSELPHTQSDAANECNTNGTSTCTPILVFWKRFTYTPSTQSKYSATPAAAAERLGCMPYSGIAADLAACQASATPFGKETYAYSLVAYYLKDDHANPSDSGWSNTARILRWEIKDGYLAYCSNSSVVSNTSGTITSPAGCPPVGNLSVRANSTQPALLPSNNVDPNVYFILPSQGFKSPDFLTEGAIDNWKKFAPYSFDTTDAKNSRYVTLVDFMDDTAYTATQGGNAAATGTGVPTAAADSAIKIPIGKNNAAGGNLDCNDPSVGVGSSVAGTVTERVPADFASATINPSGLSSFYLCVAPTKVTARMYLRGNAIARLTSPAIPRDQRLPQIKSSAFFPTADVRSFGRSAINLGRS